MIESSSDARPPLPARVLVFAPHVEEDGRLVSPHYDPPEYRAEIGAWLEELGADWEWLPITARTLDAEVIRARTLAADGNVLIFNLCDGTVTARRRIGLRTSQAPRRPNQPLLV